MNTLRKGFVALLLLVFALPQAAFGSDVHTDIGFSRLQAELGDDIPTGAGVPVTQVEGIVDGHWMPNPDHAEFEGKSLLNRSGDSGESGHATAVGVRFFGSTTSLSPGVSEIAVYEANDWMQLGRLQFLYWGGKPLASASRVANHSWVGDPPGLDSELLRRLDWIIERDEFVQVAAVNNGTSGRALFGSAFNDVSVGRTDGNHPRGTVPMDNGTYTDNCYEASRTAPHLVVPLNKTSYTAPFVSSLAALLVEIGHENPGLSTDPVESRTTNRIGDVLYNAERAEVIKAALMAGADRYTHNIGTGQIRDYRANPADRTENGLDARYGAGQVNAANSYAIVAAGEQNSLEDAPVGEGHIGHAGFDYDPAFGGASGSNRTATYRVHGDSEHTLLRVSLVWNLRLEGGSGYYFDGNATLYDLDLSLIDLTDGGAEVASSRSRTENTENLALTLIPEHEYRILVEAAPEQEDFLWDFALAWQVRSDKDGDGIRDTLDNCAGTSNPSQLDTNGDGYGNACDCDLNNDDVVNILDYAEFKRHWMATGPDDADFNGDEVVNILDYAEFKRRWMDTAPYE